MNQEPKTPPLTRKIHVAELEENALRAIEITEAERAEIARLLDLAELPEIGFEYRLNRLDAGRLKLEGRLNANVTQTCVLSLEPVKVAIDAPVEVAFWPASNLDDIERNAEERDQLDLADWPEAIADGTIDLGPVIYETLATALDPYPKKEGASFGWSEAGSASEDQENGPFAALEQLRKR